MNERDCFIRQICEQPDDDVRRLVFADWLEEHGEPEGAVLRRYDLRRINDASEDGD